jgi:ankyrin repeat protein
MDGGLDDIWVAARHGDLGQVQRLVGQDPGLLDARGDGGGTPLMNASCEGHVKVMQWLLNKGASINERDDGDGTALWLACIGGNAHAVRLLLEGGADPSIAPPFGATCLMIAVSKGHLEVRARVAWPSRGAHPSTDP